MYHYYIQKSPPDPTELANCRPIERLFYLASMQVEIEDENKRLENV